MQVDDVFKDVIGDMTCLRIALEELKAAQSAGNLPAFNALFGTFGSTLYHVTERAEKFHDVTDRWDFINNNLAVSLCYEMGTRYKHGLLDQRYLSRHPAQMKTVSASASAVYTILEPWEVIPTEKNSGIPVPVATRKPKNFVKYIAQDKTRHRAVYVAQQALSALEGWLSKHNIPVT